MSKTRYGWWSYVKDMIRRYPDLQREYATLHKQRVTRQFELPLSCGTGVGRSTEACALRELPTTKQREYEAVRQAIDQTKAVRYTGQIRLQIIELMYWARTHNLDGAAMAVHCSYATVRRYHADFICLVARYYGLLDE